MLKLLGIILCLLLIGCSVQSEAESSVSHILDESKPAFASKAVTSDSSSSVPSTSSSEDGLATDSQPVSDSDQLSEFAIELEIIMDKQSHEWTEDDYLLVLNTPRKVLWDIVGIEREHEINFRDFDFYRRFYIFDFGQSRLEYARYYQDNGACDDYPLFICMAPSEKGLTATQVMEQKGKANILDRVITDMRPAGGTTQNLYQIFYYGSPLSYLYHLQYYGDPLPEEEQMCLEVSMFYVLPEDTPLIDKDGNFIWFDLEELHEIKSGDK